MSKKRVSFFFLFGLFTIMCLSGQLSAEVDLSIFGYLENRFFLVNQTDVSWEEFKEKFLLGDYNRLRLNLKAKPSEKVTVNVAVDFFTFHGIMTGPLGTYGDDSGNDGLGKNTRIDLDRAFVNLYFKKFDLSVGKQRVALGISYIWAPLDVFNRVNVLEPKEEKPGVNAIKAYIPLGKRTALTAVFSPDDRLDTSSSALRLHTQLGNVDIAATAIRDGVKEQSIWGLDLRGELGIGWWLEGAYIRSGGVDDMKLVVGADYTFPLGNGLYWLNEYFYDSSGEGDRSLYDYNLVLSGERFTLGRNYLFSMFQYGVNQLLSVSLSGIVNLEDGSYTVNPSVSYDIMQNVNLSTGFYFPLGKENGEFNISKRSMFFLWLKINF